MLNAEIEQLAEEIIAAELSWAIASKSIGSRIPRSLTLHNENCEDIFISLGSDFSALSVRFEKRLAGRPRAVGSQWDR